MEETHKPSVPLICQLFAPCTEALSLHYRLLKPWESPLPLHQYLQSEAESVSAAITTGRCSVDSALTRSLPALKHLFTTSAGLDHVDLDECKRRGIAVAYAGMLYSEDTADYAGMLYSEDTADYAVGLLIDALRRISAAEVREQCEVITRLDLRSSSPFSFLHFFFPVKMVTESSLQRD